jgi:pimeloyl-ACP methyl ester carboxylesterase
MSEQKTFVFIHGAFRGGWYWGPVAELLRGHGHVVHHPSLPWMGEHAGLPRPNRTLVLDDWADYVNRYIDSHDLSDVVLVGHSQGGVVCHQAVSRRGDAEAAGGGGRVKQVVFLDAPFLDDGECPLDIYPLDIPRPDPDPDSWSPPFPVNTAEVTDPELAAWMTARLTPTPVGPGLDAVGEFPRSVDLRLVFCSETPSMYPAALSRVRCDARRVPYVLLAAGHDVAVTQPLLVAEALLG